jgi:phosphomannomutase
MNKTIALFDMDGTLTPCREKIAFDVIAALRKLNAHCRIGIVSGSDFDYIMSQCAALFDFGGVSLSTVDILPCNGTKFYQWKKTRFELIHDRDMREAMGTDASEISQYQKLIRKIMTLQNDAAQTVLKSTPLIGTFMQYRGSMLNWCFIGRDADFHAREEFEKTDIKEGVRAAYKVQLDEFLKKENIEITTALGGKTSIDIYPHGWDKTFALKYYAGWDVYFVGDACQPGGNDWHLYTALEGQDRAWMTNGPEDTVNIINRLIEKL